VVRQASGAGQAQEVLEGEQGEQQEEQEEEQETDPSTLLEVSKKAVEEKEKAISSALAKRQADIKRQAEELDRVRAELHGLAAVESRDIGLLRNRLEDLDRDLAYYERDFRAKEVAYLASKAQYEKLKKRKESMVEHLTIMTLDLERRKEEKLNSLYESMRQKEELVDEEGEEGSLPGRADRAGASRQNGSEGDGGKTPSDMVDPPAAPEPGQGGGGGGGSSAAAAAAAVPETKSRVAPQVGEAATGVATGGDAAGTSAVAAAGSLVTTATSGNREKGAPG